MNIAGSSLCSGNTSTNTTNSNPGFVVSCYLAPASAGMAGAVLLLVAIKAEGAHEQCSTVIVVPPSGTDRC